MINNAFCEFNRPRGNLELIFPIKDTLSYYKQFFIKDYEENSRLWNLLWNSNYIKNSINILLIFIKF